MPKHLAVEWDDREARVVVGSSRGKGLVVEQAFAVELTPSADDSVAPATIGRQIDEALKVRGVGRAEALVAVGRASIELKHLTLPPAPSAELPDMVRFQAMREFNALGDAWPLDYVSISGGPAEPHSVLAAAISPQLVEQITAVCDAMDLAPKRLVLRPCAAAALLRRQPAEAGAVRLLVDPLGDEVDLTALYGPTVVFLRTARLPGNITGADGSRALLTEIRRTIAAVHNMLGGRRMESIWLCGSGEESAALVSEIEREIQLPTKLFDPLTAVEIEGRLRRNLPQQPGRFAPLVGMLLDEVEGVEHAIDFLHPRRRVEAPRRTKALAKVLVPALAVMLLVAIGAWWRLANLDGQIKGLQDESSGLERHVRDAVQHQKSATEVQAWLASDVAWLDELALISRRFPPAKEAMLTKFHAVTPSGTAQLDVDGLTTTAGIITAMERKARDERHVVIGKGNQQDTRNKKYEWSFKATIGVKPASKDQFQKDLSAATEPPKSEAAPTRSESRPRR